MNRKAFIESCKRSTEKPYKQEFSSRPRQVTLKERIEASTAMPYYSEPFYTKPSVEEPVQPIRRHREDVIYEPPIQRLMQDFSINAIYGDEDKELVIFYGKYTDLEKLVSIAKIAMRSAKFNSRTSSFRVIGVPQITGDVIAETAFTSILHMAFAGRKSFNVEDNVSASIRPCVTSGSGRTIVEGDLGEIHGIRIIAQDEGFEDTIYVKNIQ